jgi:hypothetical protein
MARDPGTDHERWAGGAREIATKTRWWALELTLKDESEP